MKKRAFFKEPVEPVNLLANLFGAAMFTQTMHRMGEPSTPPPQGGARQVARKEPQQARRDVRKEQQQAKRDAQKQAQPAAAAAQKKTPGARGKNWTFPESSVVSTR